MCHDAAKGTLWLSVFTDTNLEVIYVLSISQGSISQAIYLSQGVY